MRAWYCGCHPTAATTGRLNSDTHDDEAASTSSSADKLQPASSRLQSAPSRFQSVNQTPPPYPSFAPPRNQYHPPPARHLTAPATVSLNSSKHDDHDDDEE